MEARQSSTLAEDRGTESMPGGFCVTGKGVYPEDRLWNGRG